MLITLEKLKTEIKNSPQVANSILGYTDQWKSSHYNTLATLVSESLMKSSLLQGEKKFELGNTISGMTLKRFFEGQNSETASNDLRFLKTLDKLSIFLGYQDFNEFIQKNKNPETPIHIPETLVHEDRIYFENIILGCARCEFDFLRKLPEINLNPLQDFVIVGAPYHTRIDRYLHKLKEQEYVISSLPESNYEVFNLEIKNKTSRSVVIATSEFWNLNFIDGNEEPHHYHTMNQQNYFLKKDGDGNWKIWDNYNPNVWDLTDKI